MQWASTDLAYLAGIIDGEGHVQCNAKHGVNLIVLMADWQVLDWCSTHFGGTLSGEYTPENSSSRPRRCWAVSRARGLGELSRAVTPHMVLKRREMEIVTAVCDLGTPPRGRQTDGSRAWRDQFERLCDLAHEAMLARKLPAG